MACVLTCSTVLPSHYWRSTPHRLAVRLLSHDVSAARSRCHVISAHARWPVARLSVRNPTIRMQEKIKLKHTYILMAPAGPAPAALADAPTVLIQGGRPSSLPTNIPTTIESISG